MKLAAAVPLAVLFGSTTLLAQSSAQNLRTNSKNATAVVMLPPASACPIEIDAQRQTGSGSLAMATQAGKGVLQSIHLSIENTGYKQITGIRITVHGLRPAARVSPAQTISANSTRIARMLDLKLQIGGKSKGSADITLAGFTSVRSIDLDSVSYTGGSSWRPSASRACHVFPDGSMLIASR